MVPGLVGDLLVVPLRERVASRAQQLDVHRVRDGADRGDRVGDVVDGRRDGVADAARDLDGVGQQLAGDRVALERGALLERVDAPPGARGTRSPVAPSASMSSHSSPTEERADVAKGTVIRTV